MERRISERLKTGDKYRAKLILAEQVKIKDISLSGICLETSERLNTNGVYRIEIVSSNNEKVTPISVVIRSFLKGTLTKGNDTMPLYDVGLKFVELNESERQFLERLVKEVNSRDIQIEE